MVDRLKVLILEDDESDAELLTRELNRAKFEFDVQLVDNKEDYLAHLNPCLDVILADYNLPNFDALTALRLLKAKDLDVPFIVVSGTIWEDGAVAIIKEGATDYLLKDRLKRLPLAVEHAIAERTLEAERRLSAKDALRTNSLLNAMIHHSPMGVVAADNLGTITRWNPIAESLLGWTETEAIGRPLLSLLRGGEQMSGQEHLAPVLNGSFVDKLDLILKRKDGRLVDVELSTAPMYDLDCTFLGTTIVATDISRRKAAEQTVQGSLWQMTKTLEGTVKAMGRMLEKRDPYTAGHERRVAQLARAVAQDLGFSEQEVSAIELAAIVHDIGKISIPTEILAKPGNLTDVEQAMIETHPQVGYDLLEPVGFPWPIATVVLQHHERLDGSGYPAGLKEQQITMEARIIGVADVVEAISTHRPYRPALGTQVALNEISANEGVLYSSEVVQSCLTVFSKGFNFE